MRTSSIAAAGIVIASAVAVSRSDRVKTDGLVTAAADMANEVREQIMPTAIDLSSRNLRAFLAVIRHSEGTDRYSNPYRVRFGGSLVPAGLKTHPGGTITATVGGRSITSSAAGAYQFLKRTWDWIAPDLNFGTVAGQDEAAARLIRYRGALGDVYSGNFAEAVRKCRKEWASLPGAGYGQPEVALSKLRGVYLAAGGFDVTGVA